MCSATDDVNLAAFAVFCSQSAVRPSHLFHVDPTLSSPPTKHFCANRWPRYFGSYCVFQTHPFHFLCSPIFFRPKCLPVLCRAFFQLLCASFGSHRASFDHELLRLIQRLLLVKYGVREIHLLCLLYEEFFTQFVCSNISLKIQRLYGTYWS